MDKYEYKLKLEQIKNLVEAKDYKTAAQIADGINWRKVKSVSTLCMIGELYERTKQLEESREILLMAYDRSPVGRNIIYRLTYVAIKMGNLEEAQEYYEEFIEIAPHDNMKYVLKYEIARAKGAPLPELISILEEFKEREYTEEWAFELAYLYHRNGNVEKCVEICDELILWFGEGKYVEKALELKMLYQPLNKLQEDKYRRFKQKQEGVVEVSPKDHLQSGEIVSETVKIPSIQSDPGRFSTMNLQEELAKSMQQIMDATEQGTVSDTIKSIKKMVGEVPHFYEPQNVHEEPEEEIADPGLDIDFQEILSEEYDGQISLQIPDAPKQDIQITGQMSIEDILAEWEKTKEAARLAIAREEQRKLESVKAKALQEAEDIMERLADVEQPEEDVLKQKTARIPEREIAEAIELAEAEPEETIEPTETAEPEETIEPMETAEPETAEPEEIPGLSGAAQAAEAQKLQEESLEERVIKQQQKKQQELERQIREEQLFKQEITLEKDDVEEKPLDSLDEEQRKIFTYFTLISGMEKQLCQALEGVRQRKRNNQTSRGGNLIIMGGRGSGKTVLATDFVKAYQRLTGHSGGKVGKISASALNQKDAGKLFSVVEGGYLIIEKAGNLSKESVDRLSGLMDQDTGGLMVILEDDRSGIEKAMSRNAEFAKKFTERIHVPIFTSDELVEFAKAYAREHDCEIEDMGILALYNSISNIQKLDEATTLTEVKEIMDDAISRANRGGIKKLFGRNRSTENGLVLIREKDFE